MRDFEVVHTRHSSICYEYIPCQKPFAETILFVHGMGLDMTTWDEVVKDFKSDYHILRYDLPGNGRSELTKLHNFGWDSLIDDLEFLLHHLNIKNVHFIGHSGAGNFGVELSLRDKAYIKSLILISTPLYVPSELTENEIKERNQWDDEAIFEEKINVLATTIVFPAEENKVNRLINIYKQTSIDTYLAYFNLYSKAVYQYKIEDLAKITVPILLLVGEFDTLYPPQLIMMNTYFLQNASFFVIPNAANAVMIDQPARFVEDVHNFLCRLGNAPKISTYDYTEEVLEKLSSIVDKGIQYKDAKIRLNIIDKFELILDGKLIEGKWNQRKAMQIITYIIYYRSVTREQLYDIFWPHYDIKKARNNFSVALNHIKSIIETSTGKKIDEYFIIKRNVISIKHHAQIDIIELQEDINQLSKEKNNLRKLSNSLALFQSLPENICTGFYDDWITRLKMNIEHQILNICEELLDIENELKFEEKQKVDLLKMLIKYNPLEASYYEKLIIVLKELGSPEARYYMKKLIDYQKWK